MSQSRRQEWSGNPPTIEQYHELDLTRPLTDAPIGALTASHRDANARASAVFTEADSEIPDRFFEPREER